MNNVTSSNTVLSFLRVELRSAVLLLFAAILLLVGSFPVRLQPESAEAQTFAYRLNGGPFNRETWIGTTGTYASWYYDRAQLAIASWNLAQTFGGQYVASFTQQSLWSLSELDWYSADYGYGYRGLTLWYLYGGTPATTSNWDYAELRLNDTPTGTVHGDAVANTTSSKQRVQSTSAHEMGHGLALSHVSSEGSTASRLMSDSISRYDIYGTYTPMSGDIAALDAAY